MSLDYEAIREWDIVVSQVMFKFKTPFTNFGVRLIPQDCVESRGRLRCRCLNQFASMSLDYKAIRKWDIVVTIDYVKCLTNFGVRLNPQDCVESRGGLRCSCLNQFASMSLDFKAIREWDIAVSQTMDNYLPADYGVLVQYPYFW